MIVMKGEHGTTCIASWGMRAAKVNLPLYDYVHSTHASFPLRLEDVLLYALCKEEAMLASVDAVSPGLYRINQIFCLLLSQLLDSILGLISRRNKLPLRVGVQCWKSEPVGEFVFLEVGEREDDEGGK